jgi:hypothetical protein
VVVVQVELYQETQAVQAAVALTATAAVVVFLHLHKDLAALMVEQILVAALAVVLVR